MKSVGIRLTGTEEQLNAAIAKFSYLFPELKDESRQWYPQTKNPTDPPTYSVYFRVYSYRNRITIADELRAAKVEIADLTLQVADLIDELEKLRELYDRATAVVITERSPHSPPDTRVVLSPNDPLNKKRL